MDTINVRLEGLEPPRITSPDPKSGASANFATIAFIFTTDSVGFEPTSPYGRQISSLLQ